MRQGDEAPIVKTTINDDSEDVASHDLKNFLVN